jgi:hypothetical protein
MAGEFTRLGRGFGDCVQPMIRGTYLMHYDGWMNPRVLNPQAPSTFVPAFGRGIAAIVDSNAGAATGSATHNYGGAIYRTALRSWFRLNSDCTGAFSVQIDAVGDAPFIVTENGDRIIVLQTALPALQYYERISIP